MTMAITSIVWKKNVLHNVKKISNILNLIIKFKNVKHVVQLSPIALNV